MPEPATAATSVMIKAIAEPLGGRGADRQRRGELWVSSTNMTAADCYRALSIAVTRLDRVVWTEWSLT